MPTAYTTIALVRPAAGMNNSTTIPDTYVTAKIAYATGVINGKVGDVYALPLSSVPDLVAWLALELTVVALFQDQYGDDAGDGDKSWKKRYDLCMQTLDDIQEQKMKLYDTSGVELTRSDTKRPGYYPNAASSDPDATDSTEAKVTMNRRF